MERNIPHIKIELITCMSPYVVDDHHHISETHYPKKEKLMDSFWLGLFLMKFVSQPKKNSSQSDNQQLCQSALNQTKNQYAFSGATNQEYNSGKKKKSKSINHNNRLQLVACNTLNCRPSTPMQQLWLSSLTTNSPQTGSGGEMPRSSTCAITLPLTRHTGCEHNFKNETIVVYLLRISNNVGS